MRTSRITLVFVTSALALAGCGGGADPSAWCSQYVTTAKALDAADLVPADVNPEYVDAEVLAVLERAVRELERLKRLETPAEIADEFEIITTWLSAVYVGPDGEDTGFVEAMAALEEFLRSDCGIDPDTLAPLLTSA